MTDERIRDDFVALAKTWASGVVDVSAVDGETPVTVSLRAMQCLFGEIIPDAIQNDSKNVVMVCHSRFNRILLAVRRHHLVRLS